MRAGGRVRRRFRAGSGESPRAITFHPDAEARPKPYIGLKVGPGKLPAKTETRPLCGIFVYSPRVEGVHLRGGRRTLGGVRRSPTAALGTARGQAARQALNPPSCAKEGIA